MEIPNEICEAARIDGMSEYGIYAKIENNEILVGNKKLMDKNNIEVPSVSDIGTIVYVSKDNKYEGYILIKDRIKEDSKTAVSNLKETTPDYLKEDVWYSIMGNKLLIGVMTFITVISTTIAITASIKVMKFKANIITLEEKLANTESANEVLVEQLKQILGGR